MNMLNQSLWGDESFSAIAVQRGFGDMIGVVARDTAPPGYYIANWLWTRGFGFSEMGIRTMSTLMMIVTAVYAGLIVKELFKSKWEAVVAGIVVFFAPFLFDFAFEGRMYAILGMFSTMSFYYLLKKNWAAYSVTAALTLYAQHFGIFVIASQGLWFVADRFVDWVGFLKKKKLGPILRDLRPFFIMILLYSPWIYPLYKQVTRVGGGGFWLGIPKVKDLLEIGLRFLTGGVKEEYRIGVAVIVLVLGLGKKWGKYKKELVFCMAMFVGPIILSFLVSQVMTSVFFDRYLLSSVVMAGIFWAGGNRKWGKIIVSLLAVFLVVISGQRFFKPEKRDFRELSRVIKSQIEEDDVLINYNGGAHHLWESKYYGVGAPIWSPGGPLPYWVGTAQMEERDVIYELPEVEGRLGVMSSESIEKTVLPEEWKRVDFSEVGSLKIIWYREKSNIE